MLQDYTIDIIALYYIESVCNSSNTSMRFVSDLLMWHPREIPEGGVFKIKYKPNGCITTALFYGVCEQTKGTLNLCLAWRGTILYCWFCGGIVRVVYSWWKALDFYIVKPEELTRLTRVTFLEIVLSINIPLMLLTTSWLLILYAAESTFCIANGTCMALQHSSARPSWSVV